MPKEKTADQAFDGPDQNLTTLFSRLTDNVTELFDAKLELIQQKGGKYYDRTNNITKRP
jgi:hypothetical protein